MKAIVQTITIAVIVVLAGCAGGVSVDSPDSNEPSHSLTSASDRTDSGVATGPNQPIDSTTGLVQFYLSDQPQAISDFRHLNVTISRVGFHQSDDNGSWVEYEVDNRTADLTQLQGDNATLINEFDLENGTYNKVFVYVSDVNGTLTTGEQVNVKLPSEKLHINKPFVVAPNESVSFVFDIAVHKAGKSGKYILRPVIGESGTDVPINDVETNGNESSDVAKQQMQRSNGSDNKPQRAGASTRSGENTTNNLTATFVGPVKTGQQATVKVSRNGNPISNATVVVNGQQIGVTGPSGQLSFGIPTDADELEVEISKAGSETEVTAEIDDKTNRTD